MRTPPSFLAALVTAALIAGCNGDDRAGSDAVDLEGATDAPTTDDAATGEDAAGDDAAGDDAAGDDAAGDDGAGDDRADAATDGDLVDISRAVPGTWPVGDAGTVTWDVRDGALVLLDHTAAEGWETIVEEEDDDEIEVDFRRDGEAWDFEVELDDGRIEVDINYDRTDAEAGAYDLPDGGSFVFEADGDALTLTSIEAPDGWDVAEREEEGDEFSFDLVDGDRRIDVEVELDDGRIEVEIDYRVVGDVS
ncbi:hypothetical protein [Egicoccus sp. AB-alg6-2]|uniref:hypothetical protein n=1 Tax=Egicoccus sp. AB-alg6-2 TaxID=3242692 RepID=UPI00359E6258